MSKWECSSCGYMHAGAEPPEKCPLCGADRSRFKAAAAGISGEDEAKQQSTSTATPPARQAPGSQEKAESAAAPSGDETPHLTSEEAKRWKCMACGYIHAGDAPPDKCPLCGADRSRFRELTGEGDKAPESPPEAASEETGAAQAEADDTPGIAAPEKKKPAAIAQKQWKCMACGYIHAGDSPPDKCPLCGADRARFDALPETEAERGADKKQGGANAGPTESAGRKAPVKKWKCTACGYIHTGGEPPERCPLCGAAREQFAELPETDAGEGGREGTGKDTSAHKRRKGAGGAAGIIARLRPKLEVLYEKTCDLILEHHLHPLMVHVPNGVGPMAVLFVLMASFFGLGNLAEAAHYNMIFVLFTMPLVLFTGYVDWKRRYGGNMTRLFLTKIVCGGIVTLSAAIIVIWRLLDPSVLETGSSGRLLHMLLYLVMLAASAVAGYNGGKLVFQRR